MHKHIPFCTVALAPDIRCFSVCGAVYGAESFSPPAAAVCGWCLLHKLPAILQLDMAGYTPRSRYSSDTSSSAADKSWQSNASTVRPAAASGAAAHATSVTPAAAASQWQAQARQPSEEGLVMQASVAPKGTRYMSGKGLQSLSHSHSHKRLQHRQLCGAASTTTADFALL